MRKIQIAFSKFHSGDSIITGEMDVHDLPHKGETILWQQGYYKIAGKVISVNKVYEGGRLSHAYFQMSESTVFKNLKTNTEL